MQPHSNGGRAFGQGGDKGEARLKGNLINDPVGPGMGEKGGSVS